jgi:hypothetical protein
LATNLSTLSNILKEYYLGPVSEQLNNEVLLLSRLESKTEDLVGRRAYVPLHWGRSGGVGARAESAALPSAGNQQYEKAVYDLKYLYGRVEVTGPSMAKTKNEAGAFLQALKSELDGIRNDLRKDLARQVYGDGTAKIATATAVTGTSGVTMTVGSQVVRKGQVYPGMVVNVYSSGGTAYTAAAGQAGGPAWPTIDVLNTTKAFVVSAVSIDAGTITLNAPTATFAIGDYITRAGVASYASSETPIGGSGGTYSLSDEIDGLQRIVSDSATAFGGITPTGSAFWWDNQRVAAGSTDLRQNAQDPQGVTGSTLVQNLTFGTVQQGLNKARIAGGMPSSIVTSFGVQREFYTLFTTQVQYIDPKTLDYQQGFKTLSYNGMPVIADIEAPYGKMYILDESTLKVYSDQDWHFLDADGLTLRQVTGYDKFEAIMARYMNLGATRRNNQVVITGIKVDGNDDAGY